MATPVTFVPVSGAGHSRTKSGGAKRTGGVESRTVMRWTHVLWLLHSSVAVQVRSIKLTVRPGPGMPGGCGGGVGGGPNGGCCCGGGRALILFALIEIVLLPMLISSDK